MARDRMRVGAGKAQVDLTDVLPFDGFDVVRHPLMARALVVEARGERVCIISLEITSARERLVKVVLDTAAEAAGCARDNIWFCVTHTFSAPHLRTPEHLSNDAEQARNERLLAAYVTAVRTAASQATARLAPAELSVGTGVCPVNVNRDVETPAGWWIGRDPEGFSDHSLPVLRFSTPDGATIAVVFSADVQSSVLDGSRTSDGARVVSGDLAGFSAASIERSLGGEAVALFLEGAAGDQAPVERARMVSVADDGTLSYADAHEDGYRMLHNQGARLSDAVCAALNQTQPVACDTIVAEQHELTCPGQQRADFHALAPTRIYEFHLTDPVTTTVSALALGPVVLLGVEPEISSRLGAFVREASSAAATIAVTLVNGAAKYLPDDDAYDKITYEAMNSHFARGSAEMLTKDLLDTATQLARKEPNL